MDQTFANNGTVPVAVTKAREIDYGISGALRALSEYNLNYAY
jgi:hypothetical protein